MTEHGDANVRKGKSNGDVDNGHVELDRLNARRIIEAGRDDCLSADTDKTASSSDVL